MARALVPAIAILLAMALPGDTSASEAAPDPRWGVMVFGGNLLDNKWDQVFLEPQALKFENSYLFGGAIHRRIARPFDWMDVEVEVNGVKHFGAQRHWEVNGPLVTGRITRFPWSHWFDMSAAFGLGPSFASEVPRLEGRNEGSSERVLMHWFIELDTALPAENWRAVWRLHHRSTSYGLMGDDGGSNALMLGIRRQF